MERQRVLIVDDDDAVLDTLGEELSTSYEVTRASCGLQAVETLDHTSFDVVISDLRMPDLSGVEVLEHARGVQPGIIRILLTGYLDEGARRATLQPDAPFKIAKPWHDALEVTLRRALEHRERTRTLATSLAHLAVLEGLDDALSSAPGASGLAEIVVARLRRIPHVETAQVVVPVEPKACVLAAFGPRIALGSVGDAWVIDDALDHEGSLRLRARGAGRDAFDLTSRVLEHTRRWTAQPAIARMARAATYDEGAQSQLLTLVRRADLGAMSASLVHELASMIQHFSSLVAELEPLIEAHPEEGAYAAEALRTASEASGRILTLFKHMRAFVHSGELAHRPCDVDAMLDAASSLTSATARGRAKVIVHPSRGATVVGNETLLVQVLVNLIRNAVEASPSGGKVELDVTVDDAGVHIGVTDDGPGVPEAARARLFEAFSTGKGPVAGTGLGLALAAHVARVHGGSLSYDAHSGRGARFVLTLPR